MGVRTRFRHAALALALCLAPGTAREGDGPGQPPELSLSVVRDHPSPHLGTPSRVVVQFQGPVAEWNPWLTRFGTSDYRAWSGWSDEHMLWQKDAWEDDFARLFTRRGSAADLALGSARPHERWELLAVAQDVFLGEPWIEVREARRLSEFVSEGSVLHAGRVRALLVEGSHGRALGELDRAEVGSLPAHAREALSALRAEVEQAVAAQAEAAREKRR